MFGQLIFFKVYDSVDKTDTFTLLSPKIKVPFQNKTKDEKRKDKVT